MKPHCIVKEEPQSSLIKEEDSCTIKSEQEEEEEEVLVGNHESDPSHGEQEEQGSPVAKRPKVEEQGLHLPLPLPPPQVDHVEDGRILPVKSENIKEEGIKQETSNMEDERNQNHTWVQSKVETEEEPARNVKTEATCMDQGKEGHAEKVYKEEGEENQHEQDGGQETMFEASNGENEEECFESRGNTSGHENRVEYPLEENHTREENDDKVIEPCKKDRMDQQEVEATNNTVPRDDDFDDDTVNNSLRRKVDSSGMYAFCCCNCKCKVKGRKQRCYSVKNNCANSSGDDGRGNTKLYHRGCCHNFRKLHADYLSPLQISIDAALEAFGIEEEEEGKAEALKSIADVGDRFKNGQNLVAEFESSEWKNKYGESIDKNPVYIQFRHDFNARIQGEKRKKPLCVLDLFCGIGSGMVVLKKLKIPLCTVVHVEHDPVAVEVCKFRHENDGIRHVYVEAFEDIYGDVDSDEDPDEELLGRYIDEYGPFDLVLAAAPCQYDSHGHAAKSKKRIVNANYLWKVGVLIQKMNDIQKSQHGVRHDVLFLSQHTILSQDMKLGGSSLDAVNQSYGEVDGCGLGPIQIDAKDFSPCKRNCLYWCNMPIKSAEGIKSIASRVSADVCLDEGYIMPERILESEGLKQQDSHHAVVKANTFMSTLNTIDDDRMIKVKKESENYSIDTFSIREREKMLGLPLGYIQDAIHHLYHSLTTNAFLNPETKEGTSHRDFLDPSLWHFRKKCYFQFKPRYGESPFFQIEISAPRKGKQAIEYFDEDSYCKHLLGNAWSLPVMEHLLEPLRDLFEKEDDLETYPLYDYSYPWEPYAFKGKMETSAPEAEL